MSLSPGDRVGPYEAENEKGDAGVRIATLARAKASGTDRAVVGFRPGPVLESFGIAPDGERFAVAELQNFANILLVEGVEGVTAQGGARN
jgi:hypothetical protein